MAHIFTDNERKHVKTSEELVQTTGKGYKNLDLRKFSSCYSINQNNQANKKQPRKGDHPVRLPPLEVSQDCKSTNMWVCKNSACKAVLSLEDTFCRRCSCCICHQFDDNKDPSLWLVCSSEDGDKDCCGLSCHIECALVCQKVGVFNLGQSMLLDGSYCCAACGKVSGIIGLWKRQLSVAKDARRVDVLCYRIFLSFRLLDGTLQFKELHQIVEEAKAKLETEVGSINGVSAKMARGIVSRLSVAADVQKLCVSATEKADEWLQTTNHANENHKDTLPAACRFHFEEVTSCSLIIVLKETSSSVSDAIKGYKLWYCSTREQSYKKDPVIFPRFQRKILISNLQPCTEYSFRIISFTEDGDLGHSESKCFTKSVEVINKHIENNGTSRYISSDDRPGSTTTTRTVGFKVRNLGRILRRAWAQEEFCYDGFYQDDVEESCGGSNPLATEAAEEDQPDPAIVRRLDLNASVPDLNADITLADCFPDDENGCSSEKNDLARSNGSGGSQTCATSDQFRPDCGKELHIGNEEVCDGDSTLINGSPDQFSPNLGHLDEDYEYCVKVVRWLECLGHIDNGFRMKFLTWFSLRSTQQERRVVITYIRTLVEEPSSLAAQLLDSFSEIVNCKRLRNGFCSKLWHF